MALDNGWAQTASQEAAIQVTKEGIERIEAASELSAVVAERGIEIRKKGRVVAARYPFHEENTASFTITPSRGLFHCFGCGAAGDVIGFGTKHDRVSFSRALEALALRAGLSPPLALSEPTPSGNTAQPEADTVRPSSQSSLATRCAPLVGLAKAQPRLWFRLYGARPSDLQDVPPA